MAQVLVRNVEERVKTGLQRRAKLHGRSMEEEIREILRSAVKEKPGKEAGLGTRAVALFRKCALDAPIPELRGHLIQPVDFDE